MGILIKKEEDIEKLRVGGKHHAEILQRLKKEVEVGVSTADIDRKAGELLSEYGDESAFLGYTPERTRRAFPSVMCISVNEVIVHGIPAENPVVLKEGDIVTLDLGVVHDGMITDAAITVVVGQGDAVVEKLVKDTERALYAGIEAIQPDGHVGDISAAIEAYTDTTGFSPAHDLAGHGVGYYVHEDPYVPNEGKKGTGPRLVPGMVIAIEPMLCEGSGVVDFDPDEYTVRTKDGLRSAHFEHTVLITHDGYEILTMT
tara:strand:- start:37 stop:810 length:774 start_codon:yes stop_codon:yes gene_type:complete